MNFGGLAKAMMSMSVIICPAQPFLGICFDDLAEGTEKLKYLIPRCPIPGGKKLVSSWGVPCEPSAEVAKRLPGITDTVRGVSLV